MRFRFATKDGEIVQDGESRYEAEQTLFAWIHKNNIERPIYVTEIVRDDAAPAEVRAEVTANVTGCATCGEAIKAGELVGYDIRSRTFAHTSHEKAVARVGAAQKDASQDEDATQS